MYMFLSLSFLSFFFFKLLPIQKEKKTEALLQATALDLQLCCSGSFPITLAFLELLRDAPSTTDFV